MKSPFYKYSEKKTKFNYIQILLFLKEIPKKCEMPANIYLCLFIRFSFLEI